MAKHGFQQNHNASVSGGTDNSRYYVGLGYTNEDGILITDKDSYERMNASAYYEIDLKPWLTTKVDLRYANSNRSQVEHGGRETVWSRVFSLPSYINYHKDTYLWTDGKEYPYESSRSYLLNNPATEYGNDDLRLFASVVLHPLKNLNITGEYTFNTTHNRKKDYIRSYPYVSSFLQETRWSAAQSSFASNNDYSKYNAFNVYADYGFSLNQAHNFSFMAGFNQELYYSESREISNTGVVLDNLPSLSGTSGIPKVKDIYQEYAIRGGFYRIGYDYMGKYLFEASGRYDGSSRFPKKSRFGFFPSFNVGWRVSEEKFMEPLKKVVSNLKLRGNWGEIGNQVLLKSDNTPDNYPYIPGMSIVSDYKGWILDGQQVLTFNSPGLVNPSFTWEKVQTLDIGLDLGLFGNRLAATFDWYQRKTLGMLSPGFQLPDVVGAAAPKENTADLKNNGWELKLDWQDHVGSVAYRVGFNLYDSHAKITKYDDNSTCTLFDKDGNAMHYEGQEIGEIWGYVTKWLAQEDDFNADGSLKEGLYKGKYLTQLYPGDVLYEDLDGDGEIWGADNTKLKPGDRKVIGNSTPRYQYGITGGVNWKGFDLSFILQGVGKRDLWNTTMLWPQTSWGANYKSTLDFWSPDNTGAFLPRAEANNRKNTSENHYTQTRYLRDGSFLRLQNITLAYTLPRQLISQVGLTQVKVYVSGENLYTWDHLPKGLDPEIGRWDYPYMKKISFGVNLSF
ncbi:MAG: SusC/RagA family TonB-linked outer membrane protein [Parabacteroides sp.]|nr:SusC/RagA family TonB-linked outer membrane protein [Parabacteroides sp.]